MSLYEIERNIQNYERRKDRQDRMVLVGLCLLFAVAAALGWL